MANLQAVGTPTDRPATLTDRLMEIKSRVAVAHTRIAAVASRAGLLAPVPAVAGQVAGQPERSDLSGIVDELERLYESLLNDCTDIERIA